MTRIFKLKPESDGKSKHNQRPFLSPLAPNTKFSHMSEGNRWQENVSLATLLCARCYFINRLNHCVVWSNKGHLLKAGRSHLTRQPGKTAEDQKQRAVKGVVFTDKHPTSPPSSSLCWNQNEMFRHLRGSGLVASEVIRLRYDALQSLQFLWELRSWPHSKEVSVFRPVSKQWGTVAPDLLQIVVVSSQNTRGKALAAVREGKYSSLGSDKDFTRLVSWLLRSRFLPNIYLAESRLMFPAVCGSISDDSSFQHVSPSPRRFPDEQTLLFVQLSCSLTQRHAGPLQAVGRTKMSPAEFIIMSIPPQRVLNLNRKQNDFTEDE